MYILLIVIHFVGDLLLSRDSVMPITSGSYSRIHASRSCDMYMSRYSSINLSFGAFFSMSIFSVIFLTLTLNGRLVSFRFPILPHISKSKLSQLQFVQYSLYQSPFFCDIISTCFNLHHTLAALKRYFPASLVAPLPSSEQNKSPFLKIILTQSRRQNTSITTMPPL